MARRKKPRLNVAREARRRARRGVGLPPPERIIPDKQTKPAKHKKTFVDLLNEEWRALNDSVPIARPSAQPQRKSTGIHTYAARDPP